MGVAELAPDDPLFPGLASKQTHRMIRRDLEVADIPYVTDEGIADFHAAGRHTHITSLLRSGVKLVEAKELARHSDVRMTMQYTHIGLEDQAKAVAKLPSLLDPAGDDQAPDDDEEACLQYICSDGGGSGQDGTVAVSESQPNDSKEKRPNTRSEGGLGVSPQSLAGVGSDCKKATPTGLEPATTGSTGSLENKSFSAFSSVFRPLYRNQLSIANRFV